MELWLLILVNKFLNSDLQTCRSSLFFLKFNKKWRLRPELCTISTCWGILSLMDNFGPNLIMLKCSLWNLLLFYEIKFCFIFTNMNKLRLTTIYFLYNKILLQMKTIFHKSPHQVPAKRRRKISLLSNEGTRLRFEQVWPWNWLLPKYLI